MLSEQEYKKGKKQAMFAYTIIVTVILFIITMTWFIDRPDNGHWDKIYLGTIMSITGSISKSGYYNTSIFVRLPDGSTREFGIAPLTALQCRAGEAVPILQQGVSVELGPTACLSLIAKKKNKSIVSPMMTH